MTIADKLTLLQQDIANARTAITTKGGTVTTGGGSSQLATDIATIPAGGGNVVKLADIRLNGAFDSKHFVQVKSVKSSDATDMYDTGISLEGTIPILEKVVIYQNYSSSGSKQHAWFGYNISTQNDGFGMWANTILRYICSPSTTIERYSFSDGWYELRQVVTSGNTLQLQYSKEGGAWTNVNTITYAPVVSDKTVSVCGITNSKVSSLSASEVGIIKIKDHLTGEYIINYIPMKDDNGHCWFWDDDKEELTKLPETWTPGDVVSGGIEIDADGYDGFNVSVPTKMYGIEYTNFMGNTSANLNGFDVGDTTLRDYEFYRTFYNRGTHLGDFVYNGTTAPTYAFYYTFYGATSDNDHVDIKIPNLLTVQANAFNYAWYNVAKLRDVLIGDSNNSMTVNSNAFQYAFYGNNALGDVIIRGVKNVSANYAFGYAFAGSGSNSKLNGTFCFPDLETITANYAMNYLARYRNFDSDHAKVIDPFPKLTSVTGSQSLSYAFNYTTLNKDSVFVFPSLVDVGASNTGSICTYMFANSSGNWKYCWFPALKTIGYSDTSSYQIFSSAFNGTTTANCYQLCLPMLEAIKSTYTGTSATYGTFNGGTLLQKIWMPKLNDVTGAAQQKSFLNGCSNLKEIHFGKENETYIKSLSGYSTKFGASTSAVISFDLINRIKVGDAVYERDGDDYIIGTTHETNSSTHEFTHPNDRYAWKDPTNGNIVYTLECWTPAVGDTVYDVNDTAVGTISELDPYIDYKHITWNITNWNYGTITVNGVTYAYTDMSRLPSSFIGSATISHTYDHYADQQSMYVNGTLLARDTTVTLTADAAITVNKASCLVEGTLILMADGTERPIEDIRVGDMVMGYNGAVAVTYSDSDCNKTMPWYDEWEFSDGTIIRTAHQHRFWNEDTQSFAYLKKYDGEYSFGDEWKIGDHGINYDGDIVELIAHRHIEEECRHYTIFTTESNTYYANRLLSGNRHSKVI